MQHNNNTYEKNLHSDNSNNSTIDTRHHSFSVYLAKLFGVDIALLLAHFAFWAEKNLANNKHIHDGLVWSYDSLNALCDYFPYYSKKQIERLVNKAVNGGLLKKGNYNTSKYDRTCWYALTPFGMQYFPHLMIEKYAERLSGVTSRNREMGVPKSGNQNPEIGTPIPDTDPYSDPYLCVQPDTDQKIYSSDSQNSGYQETYFQTTEKDLCPDHVSLEKSEFDLMVDNNPHDIPEDLLLDYVRIRKSKRKLITISGVLHLNSELNRFKAAGYNPIDIFRTMVSKGWLDLNFDLFMGQDKGIKEKGVYDHNSTDWIHRKSLFDNL